MVAVRTTTEEFPELGEEIARRHEEGRDTYDEWWEGVYRIVTGPSPEHGRLLNKLVILLDPLAEAVGLHTSAPINIGVDRQDCRVPDLGIYRPDTPRSSPAFVETAAMVVEILSPGERAGEKLPFYRAWAVDEYMEIDLARGTAGLLLNRPDGWMTATQSKVLPLTVTLTEITASDGGRIVLSDFC